MDWRLVEDPTSPFSAKLRAYLRYRGIPYEAVPTNWTWFSRDLPRLFGMPMVPVLLPSAATRRRLAAHIPKGCDPEAGMIDSSQMIAWLERAYPARPVTPRNPDRAFLSHLLEDFADEYVVRLSMHCRWGNERSARHFAAFIGRGLARGVPDATPAAMAALILERQTGFDAFLGITPELRPHLDAQLTELIDALERLLTQTAAFVLGARPCEADFALYGQLYAHVYLDPTHRATLEERGPTVCDWIERLSDAAGIIVPETDDDELPWDALRPLLALAGRTYVPRAVAVAEASVARRKRYTAVVDGHEATFSTHHYFAWRWEQLQRAFEQAQPRGRLEAELAAAGYLPALAGPVRANGLYDGFPAPFALHGACNKRAAAMRRSRL